MRALFWLLTVAALSVGAVLVPLGGKSLWQRAHDRGIPQAIGRQAARAAAWAQALGHDPTSEAPEATPRKPQRTPSQARAVKKQKPAERLTAQDRKALDELVAHSR